jgi:hypothetical protein
VRIWQGDTLPDIVHTLYTTVDDVQSALNLTAGITSITCHARQNGTALFSRVVTGNASGVITHQWQAGDTDDLGAIEGEYEIVFVTGGRLTFRWDDTYVVEADIA